MSGNESLLDKVEEVSEILRSLSHPVRLKLLCRLADGECTVSELVEFCGVSQSAVSQFLGRMRLEGLVDFRREGGFSHYFLADKRSQKLMKSLKDIYCV